MDHTEKSSPVLIMATLSGATQLEIKWPVARGNISYEEKNAQNTGKVLNFTAPAITAYYIRRCQQHVI
jgi:hypothetical protein